MSSKDDTPTNDLEKLLELFPDKDWDYHDLSMNPNLTWKIVNKRMSKDWDWRWISHDLKDLTWKNVYRNKYQPWNWYWISQRDFVTLDIVLQNPKIPLHIFNMLLKFAIYNFYLLNK